ncbi:MAG: hypothetical protein IPJ88_11975 [Myxococcales bacterium]|nr:MAG: hypothetical protein IPJ88_11975 [Myxococcales bacterium]
MLRWFLFLSVFALASPKPAHARSEEDFEYSYTQLWSTAVRLVLVDMRYPVDERDEKMGFLLFRYQENNKEFPASIELIKDKDKKGIIKTVVQIPGMPSYVESMLLSQLRKKLLADYGPPSKAPEPEKKKEPKAPEEKKEKPAKKKQTS